MPTPAYLVGGSGFGDFQAKVIIANRDPVATDRVAPDGSPYQIGQQWQNRNTSDIWTFVAGGAGWTLTTPSTGDVSALNGDSGTAIPAFGLITIAGGTGITTSATGAAVTIDLDTTITGLTSVTSGTFVTSSATLGTTYTANNITSTGSSTNIDINITPKGTGSIIYTASRAGSDLNHQVANTDNTSLTSNAGYRATTGGTGSGDPYIQFTVTGGSTWTAGVDNSASDAFVIAASATLGTTNAASWSTAGVLTNTGNIGFASALVGVVNTSATGSGATTTVVNARAGSATFTGSSIAAGATQTLTVTNSTITGASTIVLYTFRAVTAGAAPSIVSVTNSAGSSAVVVTNGTGATTQAANLILDFLVIN